MIQAQMHRSGNMFKYSYALIETRFKVVKDKSQTFLRLDSNTFQRCCGNVKNIPMAWFKHVSKALWMFPPSDL